jgi:hypothetical protein
VGNLSLTLLPDRAEQAILSSVRYHMQLSSASLPRLPDVGIEIDRAEAIALDDQMEGQMEADAAVPRPPGMVDEDDEEEGADGDVLDIDA